MSVSQVTDEVLYTGLVEMQELEELEEEKEEEKLENAAPPSIHKVVSRIFSYMPPLILHSKIPVLE